MIGIRSKWRTHLYWLPYLGWRCPSLTYEGRYLMLDLGRFVGILWFW